MDPTSHSTELTHTDYTVGWVCALPKEQTAATVMLDKKHPDLPKPPNDSNTYTLGSIGKHCIVIACLPKGEIGPSSAATHAAQMVRTFPSIKFSLMVGIGGGIPPKVRLGDVVVSTPIGQFSGVVQWDFGKANEGGKFERTGYLNSPPASLRTALAKLETDHDLHGKKLPDYLDEIRQKWPNLSSKYLRSETLVDPLDMPDPSNPIYESLRVIFAVLWQMTLAILGYTLGLQSFASTDRTYGHTASPMGTIINTEQRKPRKAQVHYGLIASGNQVIKDASFRDQLNKNLGGHVYCVEMEAAGLMNNFPCIVIRGICDYADSKKNKDWQEYAAMTAAAFAKDLLGYVQPTEVEREQTANDILLGRAVKRLDEIQQDVSTTRVKIDKKEELEILDWITPIEYGPQQSEFLKTRQPGTCQWFLSTDEYQNWLTTDNQTLYCPGIPGAGKTILTAATIDDLLTRYESNPDIVILYIFCDFRRTQQQRLEDLLASLLKQISQKQLSLPEAIKSLHNKHRSNGTRPSLSEIILALHLIAAMYSRIFIVVDALDELQATDGSRMGLLKEIFDLQKKTRANFFATSRPNLGIEVNFKGCQWYNIFAREDDLRRYLHGHMPQLLGFVQERPNLQAEIEEEITTAADGMFLLAKLYFDSLKDKTSAAEIKKSLRHLRKKSQEVSGQDQKLELLSQAYDQAMERIHGQQPGFRKLATKVLSWVICARQQLTILELQHALAVSPGDTQLDQDNLRDITDMVSVCSGLITVDAQRDMIRLVHYTTQEYFEKTQKRWFPDAEVNLTTICITYLSFGIFETGVCDTHADLLQRLQSNPLYKYAARNWGHHARSATRPLPCAIKFLNSRSLVESSYQVLIPSTWFDGQLNSKQGTAIHLVAYFGLPETINDILKDMKDVDPTDRHQRTPLSLASANGHECIVRILLEQGAKVNPKCSHYQTPLGFAAENRHEAIVKLLLEQGAEVDLKGVQDGTPLSFAAENGHEAIVKLLLEQGAEVDSKDREDQTPLGFAAENGHKAIVKLLLEQGAEVDSEDREDGTPLSFAAENGHKAIVKLLLEQGAEVDSKDREDRTPLSFAAENGHEAIVKLLLAQGAQANSHDDSDRTPICFAAENSYMAIIKTLIDSGADLECKVQGRMTLLSWAAFNGDESMFKLFLDNGANLESRDDIGRTSLSWAAGKGHQAIVERLLYKGSDFNSKDIMGRTPLWWAAKRGQGAVVNLLLESYRVFNNSKDEFGRTALSGAAKNGHRMINVTPASNEAFGPNQKDHYGSTPLSIAARHGQTQIVRQLLDIQHIDLASGDCFGRTPLWYAKRYGYDDIIQLLLESIEKSDISIFDRNPPIRLGERPEGKSHRDCDVCTMGVGSGTTYYHCKICVGDNFNICSECYEAGGRCLDISHGLVGRKERAYYT